MISENKDDILKELRVRRRNSVAEQSGGGDISVEVKNNEIHLIAQLNQVAQ